MKVSLLLLMLAVGGLPETAPVVFDDDANRVEEVASVAVEGVVDVAAGVALELGDGTVDMYVPKAFFDTSGVRVDDAPTLLEDCQRLAPAGPSEAFADEVTVDVDSGVIVRKFGPADCCPQIAATAVAELEPTGADYIPSVPLARGGVIAH